jgi:8-oxo-dGTP pyrophosphatase MutT (NUDIX family)
MQFVGWVNPKQQMKRQMSVTYCANCGNAGHIYRKCNQPITSYGVIMYKLCPNENGMIIPKYIMVQRKDSLSYIEFMRGRYTLENRLYLLQLFKTMTLVERGNIFTKGFEELWNTLWDQECIKNFHKEYVVSKDKFVHLQKGYLLQLGTTGKGDTIMMNMAYIESKVRDTFLRETEWGFPKGRRNINESDISCGTREFSEETGIPKMSMRLLPNFKTFEETFNGTNKIRYKHVYFVATLSIMNERDCVAKILNKRLCREISQVDWLSYDEAQAKILSHNIERREMFERINKSILRYICSKDRI